MMEQSKKDAGTIAALMLRFKDFRLPRAQRLLEKVNGGAILSDSDISFLKRVYKDANANRSLVKRNPEYEKLVTGFIALYTEIVSKGVENEQAQKSR